MDEKKIKIGSSIVGNNQQTFFVADIAANWDGELNRAKHLIHLAAESKANAAKFQNFQAKTIVSDYGFKKLADGKQLSHQSTWNKSVYDVYQDASLPLEWTEELKYECEKVGLEYMTTPYNLDQIQKLSKYVSAWKIGSGDITWHDLIENLCEYDKPIMLACGASKLDEVDMAMEILEKSSNDVILMQCNTNYTASLDNFKHIHLNVLKTFKDRFPGVIIGLSDHTPGHSTVLGAVALGAKVVEKHFTDDNERIGPDHKFSMNPQSWLEMVERTRELEL